MLIRNLSLSKYPETEMKRVVNDPETEAEIISIVKAATIPVGIDYVAKKAALTWGTARAILLRLLLEKKISGRRASVGWYFCPNNKTEKEQSRDRSN